MKKWRAFLAAIARDRDHRFRVVGGAHVIPTPELPDDFDPPSVSLRPRYVDRPHHVDAQNERWERGD